MVGVERFEAGTIGGYPGRGGGKRLLDRREFVVQGE